MSCPLGFEKQGSAFSNSEWACGAYSFGHLLNLIGIPNSIDENKKKLKTVGGVLELPVHRIAAGLLNLYKYDGGTEPEYITKQIRKIGKELIIRESGDKKAKNALDLMLNKKIPLIINVDDGDHWMVVAGKYDNNYIVIDSGVEPTISFYSWSDLRDRWCCGCENCYDEDEEISSGVLWCNKCDGSGWCDNCGGSGETSYGTCRSCKGSGECIKCYGNGWLDNCKVCDGTGIEYYGIGLDLPAKSMIGTKSALKQIKHFIKYIKYDVGLQEYWGFYLRDLNEIFKLNIVGKDVIRASDFFDKYGKEIAQMVYRWIEETDYDIKYELNNYRFVAEFYDFKFHKKDLHKILVDFTAMFALAMSADE